MIANKSVEIQEQELGTYVFPAIDESKKHYSWALYVYKDGSADLYTRRGLTGELLGAPQNLPAPKDKEPLASPLTAELIHPLDLAEILNAAGPQTFIDVYRNQEQRLDEAIKVGGKLYLQSLRVPAKTKKIR